MREIPLFDLNYGQEEIEAVTRVIESRWISMGPECAKLEERFAHMLGAKYAVAVTNCTAALHLACVALGIGSGDEVICPSLTFAATVNCIKYVGATPVFCDITSVEDFGINAEMIESLITSNTKAIIPMHFAGYPCNMDELMRIAQKHQLYVIEDACHGPLSEYNGKKLGTIGNVGCFSFFSNKNISTGEGGMVVTNDENIYNKLKLLRSHGMTTMSFERAKGHATSYDIVDVGFNYRMDDIRAALANAQLNKLQLDLEKRKQVRSWYEDELHDSEKVIVPYLKNKEFVSNYIFPIVLKCSCRQERDIVREKLQQAGIQTSVHYPAVHRFAAYKMLDTQLPITDYVTDCEITLPMYSALTRSDVNYICDELRKALNEKDTNN